MLVDSISAAFAAAGGDVKAIMTVLNGLRSGATTTVGNSATRNVGTTAGTVAAGDDSRFLNIDDIWSMLGGFATSSTSSGRIVIPSAEGPEGQKIIIQFGSTVAQVIEGVLAIEVPFNLAFPNACVAALVVNGDVSLAASRDAVFPVAYPIDLHHAVVVPRVDGDYMEAGTAIRVNWASAGY